MFGMIFLLSGIFFKRRANFFDGKVFAAGARDNVGYEEIEAAFAFGFVALDGGVGDERACSLVRGENASKFELAIGADDGVWIDRKVHGELAHGGQAIAGAGGSAGTGGVYLVDNLTVDGNAGLHVEDKLHDSP
jgi:hypothetical protein